jgi:hypothetical protein
MQCQIGLENCNDSLMARNGQFNVDVPVLSTNIESANEVIIPEINVDQIEADGELGSDENTALISN